MLARVIKLAVLAGAGIAAWKAYSAKGEARPFLEQALQDGVATLQAARSAQIRGSAAELRRFAQQLEHDHEELNRKLAEAAGVDVPELDAQQHEALRRIDHLQGTDFDSAWLRHMTRGHGQAIRMFQRESDQSGPGADIATEALPKLREHDRKLAELRSAARTSNGGSHGGSGNGGNGGNGGTGSESASGRSEAVGGEDTGSGGDDTDGQRGGPGREGGNPG